MSKILTHASFFSGVGGVDLGFERAGIRTVSVSEIDPFARSVLASRFPEVPQLGDIVALADRELSKPVQQSADEVQRCSRPVDGIGWTPSGDDWKAADIWSAGFPCQDLSVAGKRKGFADGKRSVLAFTFLNLVERFRPRWLVLENVPGLFTSNNGRDLLALLREVDELGYGVSWRTLDARFFGVPQRRRRVFLVASLGTDRSGEVLLECEGGCGHTQAGESSWSEVTGSIERSPFVAGALLARYHKGATSTVENGQLVVTTALTRGGLGGGFGADDNDAQGNKLVVGSEAYSGGVRAFDGMAGRVDNPNISAMGAAIPSQEDIQVEHNTYSIREDAKAGNFSATPINTALALNAVWPSVQSHHAQTFIASAYRKSKRAQSTEDHETWVEDGVANTINLFDSGDVRTTHAVVGSHYDGYNQKLEPDSAHRTLRVGRDSSDFVVPPAGVVEENPLLPIGMDSNRYKVCGNGVVCNVAEWIGHRLVEVDGKWTELR
ncbi:Dcm Site-specific DNA methylase [uncultured Caudovirales phage]|uniref:Dcm Site-specific DNA methylase n=1 Tax=uncultured Caudovirales phage TaxID=2100421 RepID=A0A6J5MQ12_9CAUD|nr:Dcm Site-specific DNA methylase [uncultured Caudovirales phage]CAB4190657.1 Dcm Site-specific DNA methylase [uncultured Caudovirales phage]CAB4194504.1 Dcm Site-specific DNA methylase [uncultured Caudovirales phage]